MQNFERMFRHSTHNSGLATVSMNITRHSAKSRISLLRRMAHERQRGFSIPVLSYPHSRVCVLADARFSIRRRRLLRIRLREEARVRFKGAGIVPCVWIIQFL